MIYRDINHFINIKTNVQNEPITDSDITRLLKLRESKTFLKKRLEQLELDLKANEEEIMLKIESGSMIQCKHMLSIKSSERRTPSWKEAFINLAGEVEAKKIIDFTAPHITKSLVITLK